MEHKTAEHTMRFALYQIVAQVLGRHWLDCTLHCAMQCTTPPHDQPWCLVHTRGYFELHPVRWRPAAFPECYLGVAKLWHHLQASNKKCGISACCLQACLLVSLITHSSTCARCIWPKSCLARQACSERLGGTSASCWCWVINAISALHYWSIKRNAFHEATKAKHASVQCMYRLRQLRMHASAVYIANSAANSCCKTVATCRCSMCKNASESARKSLDAQAGGVEYTPLVDRADLSLSATVESQL